jgi:hypothetical protein
MILFNTTFNLDSAVEADWLTWTKEIYFTNALDSGFVVKHHLLRLRYEVEGNGSTYSAQLYFEKEEHFEKFLENWEYKAMEVLAKRYGSNVVYFQTMLDVIL